MGPSSALLSCPLLSPKRQGPAGPRVGSDLRLLTWSHMLLDCSSLVVLVSSPLWVKLAFGLWWAGLYLDSAVGLGSL